MRLALLVPGDPDTATGGYVYARRLVGALRAAGHELDLRRLSDRFPWPDEAALAEADAVLASLPAGGVAVIDGLAYGAMPGVVRRHATRLSLVALVHHPLAAESGLSAAQAARLDADERDALRQARRVVVTSAATGRAVAAMGVAAARIAVVEPGTDPAPAARGDGGTLRLLCVATLTPRKGHVSLVRALARLRSRRWHLHCAGSLHRDPATVTAVRRAVSDAGLAGHVTLHGEVDAATLAALYARADAFVLASRFEGYGMAFAEALAHGVPVVGCAAGAVPETVPPQAGLLVPPDDVDALADALRRLLDDPVLRAGLAAGARAVGLRLPDWPSRAAAFAHALAGVA